MAFNSAVAYTALCSQMWQAPAAQDRVLATMHIHMVAIQVGIEGTMCTPYDFGDLLSLQLSLHACASFSVACDKGCICVRLV